MSKENQIFFCLVYCSKSVFVSYVPFIFVLLLHRLFCNCFTACMSVLVNVMTVLIVCGNSIPYLNFSLSKIDATSQATAPPLSFQPTTDFFTLIFRPFSSSYLSTVISRFFTKSCELDCCYRFCLKTLYMNLLHSYNCFAMLPWLGVLVWHRTCCCFPSIKWQGLDLNILSNFRPIDNLAFISNTLAGSAMSQSRSFVFVHPLAWHCLPITDAQWNSNNNWIVFHRSSFHQEQEQVLLCLEKDNMVTLLKRCNTDE